MRGRQVMEYSRFSNTGIHNKLRSVNVNSKYLFLATDQQVYKLRL